MLETIPEGVLQLDREGVATYANEPIGVVLGLPRAQLIGVSLRGFLDDQGQKELTRRLAECKAGRSTVGATRLLRADGSQRSVRMSMMPLTDEHGEYSRRASAWSPTPPTTSTPAASSASSTTCAGWTAWAS